MTTESTTESGLDPNRPFARYGRGEEWIEIEEEDIPQYVQDWLNWCGLSGEELLRRHAECDFEGNDRRAWVHIGQYLEEGWHVRSLRPSA